MLPVEDILPFLPQRPPFIMVDRLVSADADSATCSLTIKAENIFLENGNLNEAGLLENMAQTAAAGTGYNMSGRNDSMQVGFIGAVKNFEVHAYPTVGDELITDIVVESRIFNVSMVTAKVYNNNMLVASCEMKVFTQTNER